MKSICFSIFKYIFWKYFYSYLHLLIFFRKYFYMYLYLHSKKPKYTSLPTARKCHTGFKFPDLEAMPPELSLQILKNLNATDLCLAACVWTSLANDDTLWQSLCKSTWGHATVYSQKASRTERRSFRYIFMHLDEATLTFNVDWKRGLEYLFRENLVANDSMEIARFINSTNKLNPLQKQKLFNEK